MPDRTRFIRIIKAPPGEAPYWVREKWVGLVLPLAYHTTKPHNFLTSGVLSGPRNFFQHIVWRLQGRLKRQSGYVVEVNAALAVLEQKAPEAASWWRKHAFLIFRKRFFVFHASACEPSMENESKLQ